MSSNSKLIKNRLAKANKEKKDKNTSTTEVQTETNIENVDVVTEGTTSKVITEAKAENVELQADTKTENADVVTEGTTSEVLTDGNVENNEGETPKKKSNRGRKKATSAATVVIKNKKAIISLSDVLVKKNKTFYLEDRYIKTLDNLSERTGLTTSQLVQIAIDLLESNLEIQGEN